MNALNRGVLKGRQGLPPPHDHTNQCSIVGLNRVERKVKNAHHLIDLHLENYKKFMDYKKYKLKQHSYE